MSGIATPELALVTDLIVHVTPISTSAKLLHGVRRIVPLTGGTFSGPRLNGRMIPGGSDFQDWRNDGATEIHARYVGLKPTKAALSLRREYRHSSDAGRRQQWSGWQKVCRSIPRRDIYFRSDGAAGNFRRRIWRWLNRGIFLCSGARFPDRVEIRIFRECVDATLADVSRICTSVSRRCSIEGVPEVCYAFGKQNNVPSVHNKHWDYIHGRIA